MMLGFKEALVSVARESEAAAGKLAGAMNGREMAHLFALRHWIAGDVERTLRSWDETDFSSGLTTDVARCEKTKRQRARVEAARRDGLGDCKKVVGFSLRCVGTRLCNLAILN